MLENEEFKLRSEKICRFKERITDNLLSELSTMLEIKKNKPYLMAMVDILIAIETVSQFIIDEEEDELRIFREEVANRYNSISDADKYFLRRDYEKGFVPAIDFMEKYFDKRFKIDNPVPASGDNLAHVVWKFRNSMAHAYYPFLLKDNSLRGRVLWTEETRVLNLIDKESSKKELDKVLLETSQQLYDSSKTGWFQVNLHVFFIYFRLAIQNYLTELENDDYIYKIFEKQYEELKEKYFFE